MIISPDIFIRRNVLYTNAVAEPSETNVSIFGLLFTSPLNPLMKNLWFTTIMAAARIISTIAVATGFAAKDCGSGNPHITAPIVIYIRPIKRTTETASLPAPLPLSLFAFFSDCSFFLPAPSATDAPYPAFSTAPITT